MGKPRFIVSTVTGYSMGANGSASKPQTSYSVLDTANNYAEVRRFYVRERGPSDFTRRTLANEAAATLNAECGE